MEIKAFQARLQVLFKAVLKHLTSSSPFILRNLKLLKEEVDRDNDEKSHKLKSVLSEVSDQDNPFEILELISDEGIKCVYRVLDKRSNREVVFATLSDQKNKEQYQFSLINDAWVSSQLEHPNIPPIYEVGIKDDKPYFLMKYLKGSTLADLLREEEKPKTKEQVTKYLRIVLDVCDALSFAHAKGILHLDIKAENIYVNSFNETLLFDWGCALNVKGEQHDARVNKVCELLESSRKTGVTWGTPEYMSPEQAKGESDKFNHATDTFLVGSLLYQIFSGKPLYFQSDIDEQLEASEQTGFIPILVSAPNLSKRLQKVIEKALSKSVGDRYQTVEALASDLQAYLDDEIMSIESATPWLKTKLFLKKHQRFSLTAILILGLISCISLVYNYLLQQSERRVREANVELNQSYKKQGQLLSDLKSISSISDMHYLGVIFEEDSLKKIETLLEFQNENPDYWFEKGRILCGDLNFKEAKACFQQSMNLSEESENQFRYSKSVELLGYLDDLDPQALLDNLDIIDLKKVLVTINDIKTRSLICKTTYETKLRTLDQQCEFFKSTMKLLNPGMTQDLVLINEKDSISIVINDEAMLKETAPFYFFPCESIDLKGSRVRKLYTLYNPKLVSLNIADTQISNISNLPNFNLKKLNIDRLSITYFLLKHLDSLNECSMIDTQFLDYTSHFFLKLMPNLKRLHVGQTPRLDEDYLIGLKQLEHVSVSKDYPRHRFKSFNENERLNHITFELRP